ncbi:GNAT family N-acetyltransferase [Sporolactobacillus sp. CPB3-1]|uniref:GNAT family N-acetyltransferase n=1 Tax=Sporolactobacillus mangiferae TaxID=2940498 RepID=A0ABT0M8W9_9BACL|nr:GNAT family N-acetyltransferase [Sporolactobacillus mangiferae]MCL1631306.1 GNAT family N-acetyltransferase [Sporolactobacillus mangiferae]
MIRQLTEADREKVLAFAGQRPAENLFIIGDIDAFGMSGDFVTLWGDFDETAALRSILLRYRGNFIPYAQSPADLDGEAWADVIEQSGQLKQLSGLQNLVSVIAPHIQTKTGKKQLCFYAKRDLHLPVDKKHIHKDVKMLFPEEAEQIVNLRSCCFPDYAEPTEALQKNMDKGISRTYYIERNNEPVSGVSTTAETGGAAMIIGVCTKKEYEHQGFATSCLLKTISALQAERKQPCLFYDNPDAGRIYEKAGFVPIDRWMMIHYA